MLSMQEVGKQILTNNPKKFYIFVGSEYGIKRNYINKMADYYGEYIEFDSVQDIFAIMQKKQLIPLKPKLYVVRYDESFIQSLNASSSSFIQTLKILGTIVCIYESKKHTQACSKYLGDYTVSLDHVADTFLKKYLTTDFPNMDSNIIDEVVSLHVDYNRSSIICNCIKNLDSNKLLHMGSNGLGFTFGCHKTTSDLAFKYGVASRNFQYTVSILDSYDNVDNLLYAILNVLLELEKVLSNPKQNSEYRKYISAWNNLDIYYMFMHTYNELEKSRTSSYNMYNGIVYILAIMQYSPIPNMEELS